MKRDTADFAVINVQMLPEFQLTFLDAFGIISSLSHECYNLKKILKKTLLNLNLCFVLPTNFVGNNFQSKNNSAS
jgi:hypothetical protein